MVWRRGDSSFSSPGSQLDAAWDDLSAVADVPGLAALLPGVSAAVGAAGVALLLLEDGQLRLAAQHAGAEQTRLAALWRAGPLEAGTPAADALLTGQPAYLPSPGAALLPLLAHGGGPALGALLLVWEEARQLDEDERGWLETLGTQLAAALDRILPEAELERRVRERTAGLESEMRAQEAFVAFTEEVGSETDVLALARRAVTLLSLRFPGCSSGLYLPEGGLWKLRVHTDDLVDTPELLALLRAGLPPETPMFLQALRSQRPTFVNGWDPASQRVERTEVYEAVAAYPLAYAGQVRAVLVLGLKDQLSWQERDRAVFRAVGRGLNLALVRGQQAEVMQQQNAELAARTQALEAFAQLTADLSVQRDPYALVRRAQEVALSLLPPGYALYYEHGGDRWLSRAQVGDVGHPELQAFIDAGPLVGQTPSVDLPWRSQRAYYQDVYAKGSDTPDELVQHVNAAASLPLVIGGRTVGVFIAVLFEQRTWTRTDRAVLETVIRALELALDRAEQARQAEEERVALETFVAFTEAASRIGDLDALALEAFRTLGTLIGGSTAALFELQDGLWIARHHTGNLPPHLTSMIERGLSAETRLFAELSRSGRPVFVDQAGPYRMAALYPILQGGTVHAALGVALPRPSGWSERDRAVIRAVGRSFALLYERISAAQALSARQQEAESRTQALEAFAQLTRELGVQGDRAALIRRAQEVVLSLLPPGYAVYFEPDAGQQRWVLRSVVGELPSGALRAALERGLEWERTGSLLKPWQSGQPQYQASYDPDTDHLGELVATRGATASVPLFQHGAVVGIFGLRLLGIRPWSNTDRAVLESVLRSLSVALERAESVSQLADRSRDLERSNSELQGANEELEAFAYSVSHDLRTPVRHIRGFNQLLRTALPLERGSKPDRYLGVIEDAAVRMDTLIDAMLELSRTSRQPLQVEPLDLNVLVASVLTELEPEVSGREVEWRISRLPRVWADQTTLRQVLSNLLSNALKYTRTRSAAVIEVWAEEGPGSWLVHVRDNGVGFEPRYAGKLFGVFQRLHRPEDFEGVGVGLANVRRIVLRHGGQVYADAVPDLGATFSFSLPKKQGAAQVSAG